MVLFRAVIDNASISLCRSLSTIIFTPALTSSISQESKWQQVYLSNQDSSEYSTRS